MSLRETDMRAFAIKRLRELGYVLRREPHKRNEQRYVLRDGKSVRLLTSRVGTLICTTDGTPPDARLSISGTDLIAFASRAERNAGDGIEIYLIPTSIVEAAFRCGLT